jgi:hypothetical protein
MKENFYEFYLFQLNVLTDKNLSEFFSYVLTELLVI